MSPQAVGARPVPSGAGRAHEDGAPVVGVVALQGAFAEHIAMLAALGADARRVTAPEHLSGVDAVVLPGGESTAMVRLAASTGLFPELTRLVTGGMPTLATCAGLVLLARTITDEGALAGFDRVPVLDVAVRRNAYGSQRDSFTAQLEWNGAGIPQAGADASGTAHATGDAIPAPPAGSALRPFPGVFIRAPRIEEVGPHVEVLARRREDAAPVLVRQGAVIAAAFHPELTDDARIHSAFLASIARRRTAEAGRLPANARRQPPAHAGRRPTAPLRTGSC